MTQERPTPPSLQKLFGERYTPLGVASMLAVGVLCAAAVVAVSPALPAWRLVLGAGAIADIGAGVVANFTASTNAWYAARPGKRWLFIASHVHLPVVALVLEWPLRPALVAWAWTIASASVVNLLARHPAQRMVAGSLFAVSLMLPLLEPVAPQQAAVAALFTLKVAYAFAVRHEPTPERAAS